MVINMSYVKRYKNDLKIKKHYISIMSNTSQEVSTKSKADFKNGKIYIIRNSVNDLTYIGSTCQSLSQRMAQHRKSIKEVKKYDMKLYACMRELDTNNFYIELLEYCPCNTRDELLKKEGECIRNLKPKLNSKIEGRSKKEWYEDNWDRLQEHRETNKERTNARMKIYRDSNKEEIRERKKIEYEKHKEQYLQRAKEYSNANKEHLDAKRKERYNKNKDEILSKRKETYNDKKDEINQRRRETMKQRKEEDENYRQELNRKHREWYAKNKEKQCQRRKELIQMREQQQQPEQEPE